MFTASKSCPCTGILKPNSCLICAFSPQLLFTEQSLNQTFSHKSIYQKFQLIGQLLVWLVWVAWWFCLLVWGFFSLNKIFLQTNQRGIKSSVVCPPTRAPGALIQTPFSRRIWCYQSKSLFSPVHLFKLKQMNIS